MKLLKPTKSSTKTKERRNLEPELYMQRQLPALHPTRSKAANRRPKMNNAVWWDLAKQSSSGILPSMASSWRIMRRLWFRPSLECKTKTVTNWTTTWSTAHLKAFSSSFITKVSNHSFGFALTSVHRDPIHFWVGASHIQEDRQLSHAKQQVDFRVFWQHRLVKDGNSWYEHSKVCYY